MLTITFRFFGCWAALSSSVLLAGGKVDSDASAADVAATLARESSGDRLDRRTLLQQARGDDRHSAAWWQSGYVKLAKGWQSWEESDLADAALNNQYQQRRDETGPHAAAQLKLADWCRDVGLVGQERTHLVQALRTGQATHPESILQRLGYRRVGFTWLTDSELANASAELASIAKQAKRLRPRLEKLAERLEGKPALREKTLGELQALANRETVWLMEQSLAGRSEISARGLVDVLSQVQSYHASQALARIGAFAPWDEVRASATGKLRSRQWEDFVPGLLEYLQEPVQLQASGVVDRSGVGTKGLLEWRFLWSREGRHSIDVACSHLLYFRHVPAGRSLTHGETHFEQNVLKWKDQVAAADFAYFSQSRAEAANDQIEEKNRSVAAVLSAVTELPEEMTPTQWWEWWDGAINQLSDSESKPYMTVAVEVHTFGFPEIQLQRADRVRANGGPSCLVDGTPVWTEEGFRPIEDIRVGDRVLSKNIETGELKYQPVLHTTYRAGATVSELKVGDETIDASLGHNFWISGRGWTRTNQMRDGMAAHTPTGTVRLEISDQTRTADVYNLVVADFHTYFVGKSMLLGHDVIVPAPTDIRVPGLDPNLTAAK